MTTFSLEPLDLAALLCSRVCHDVISPVGAIANGLEVLESEKDEDMRGFAMDLIKKSTAVAVARLQFCRLAFGAAGSAGASIDTGDAEQVARGLLADDKTKLVWNATRTLMPKNKVKLILNLCMVAAQAIPRGGVITLSVDGVDNDMTISVEAAGTNAKLQSHLPPPARRRAGERRRRPRHTVLLRRPGRARSASDDQGRDRGRQGDAEGLSRRDRDTSLRQRHDRRAGQGRLSTRSSGPRLSKTIDITGL